MCGIIGLLLKKNSSKNIINLLWNSIYQLQNRGYDSCGISMIQEDSSLITLKYASTHEKNAVDILKENSKEISEYYGQTFKVGIGHTRWATNGPKTDYNSHPHVSYYRHFSLVHNGIIENYESLKEELFEKGYRFSSDTDSEVIVNLLEYYYLSNENHRDVYIAFQKTLERLVGTYGLVVMCKEEKDKLYCVKNGSPLLVGLDENVGIVTSEPCGFCDMVNTYITLQNDDICVLYRDQNEKIQMKTNLSYVQNKIHKTHFEESPLPYCHWTIKEIYDQPKSILNAYNHGGRLKSPSEVKLGGLDEKIEVLKEIEHILLFGMGTSYHAGLLGEYYMKEICNFVSVRCYDASEFKESDIPKRGKVLGIFISQSGETKDLHETLKLFKKNDIMTMGVINVVDSLIAREVDCGVYCNGGREVGVCSTKIFTSQVIILSLISIWFSQIHGIQKGKREEMIKDLQNLSFMVRQTLEDLNEKVKEIVKDFHYSNLFILGKESMYPIACEGSLKIKEISYIHSEAYSSSSLKHGPFSLLDENFPVFILDNDDDYHSKNMNSLEEIHSRHSPIYLFTNHYDYPKKQNLKVIQIQKNKTYQGILTVISMQLFGYYLSIQKGYNCDFPRNLAKTVTTL